MARQQDTLSEIGEALCGSLGFNPTSNSTKPLYVANALFRVCGGIKCKVEDIHEWVVSERRSKAKPSAQILEDYKDIIYLSGDDAAEDVKETRFYLEKLFNPDSTVYPSLPNSVMNIPSKWLVRSSTKAEANIGDFIYDILCKPIDGVPSKAIKLIREALLEDDDDLTRTIKPLIVRKPEAERIEHFTPEPNDITWNETKLTIRRGFDRLADNCEHDGVGPLLLLRRMVAYTMFATFYYLEDINRVQYGGKRIPLLLDADYRLGAIERASEASFIACKKAVEAYTIAFATEWLEAAGVITSMDSQEAYEAYVATGFSVSTKYESKNVRDTILQHIAANCQAGDKPLLATAKAIQFALYTYRYPSTTPSDFCNVLGVKAGLVGPSGNATKYKRLLINRFLLETIVLSAVDVEDLLDGIDLRKLGDMLRDSYNIIIGTDTDVDYEVLDDFGIAAGTPEDLRGELSDNAKAIANMLISMGLAKRYADGVTIIGRGL